MKSNTNSKSFLLKLYSLFMCFTLLLALVPFSAFAQEAESSDIIILYENDMHCAIDGYSKISALKAELLNTYNYVGVVSSGDFVQGDTLGAISKGEYIVNTMNMVGYDAIALGNHEFDYKFDRLKEIAQTLNTTPVCSNFFKNNEVTPVFQPYTIKSYGDIDIAYIGVTTPDTLTSSSPAQFMDENGNYICNFSGTNLSQAVQTAIDSAKSEGADYIIGITHLGTEDVYEQWSVQTLINNTEGFDVVLDGHSHSVVEKLEVADKSGNIVAVSSTGSKFANLGKLTISEGSFKTELIPTDTLTKTDPQIDEYIESIREEYSTLGNRVVGKSEVELLYQDENGNRLIRNTQTNLGDFCADAFRVVTGADIGVINGGGIRAQLGKGEITFNELLSVYPYNNTVCVAEVTGQQILDFLELSVSAYPEENGSFQHVSGLTYTLKSYLPSPVVFNENMAFESVKGERRVCNVKVLNSKTALYEPIDENKTYTLASHNYLLLDHGDGATMLDNSNIILNSGMLDVELLEVYINEHLGGIITKEYENAQGRVTVLTAPYTEPETSTPDKDADTSQISPQTGDYRLFYGVAAILLCASAIIIAKRKKAQ